MAIVLFGDVVAALHADSAVPASFDTMAELLAFEASSWSGNILFTTTACPPYLNEFWKQIRLKSEDVNGQIY